MKKRDYYKNILGIPAIQLVNKVNVGRRIKNGPHTILVAGAASWLTHLN